MIQYIKLILVLTASLLFNIHIMSQTTEAPYRTIESYPETYSMGGVVSRMLDGLGYRYHWASKDLRQVDLNYAPGNDGKSVIETLKHIYELAVDALLLAEGQEFNRPRVAVGNMEYTELRQLTLKSIHQASRKFKAMTDSDIANIKVVFAFVDRKKEYPFWNFLNGQLSDAIYHTGQIVSFRRSSGNPVSKEMNVFTAGLDYSKSLKSE
tara:strand:- start:10126 stop:10752 length:627 start_codon:yes stop_codon:yes gene_type:complete